MVNYGRESVCFFIQKNQCIIDPEEMQIKVLAKYGTKVVLLQKSVDPLMCVAGWIEIRIHDLKCFQSKLSISILWDININKYVLCSKWKQAFEVSHEKEKVSCCPVLTQTEDTLIQKR